MSKIVYDADGVTVRSPQKRAAMPDLPPVVDKRCGTGCTFDLADGDCWGDVTMVLEEWHEDDPLVSWQHHACEGHAGIPYGEPYVVYEPK